MCGKHVTRGNIYHCDSGNVYKVEILGEKKFCIKKILVSVNTETTKTLHIKVKEWLN